MVTALHIDTIIPADTKLPQADSNFFQRREFCFTLDGDIFVRYQSFKVAAFLSIFVCHLLLQADSVL